MKEELKLFLEKLASDKDLQEKMQACKNPKEAYDIASSVQDGFTYEEFVKTMTQLRDESEKELTDEDLEKAAGGTISVIIMGVSIVATASLGAGVAMAAAD
jgi:predicted ribosomally synthesized peptide with nif11-like leader